MSPNPRPRFSGLVLAALVCAGALLAPFAHAATFTWSNAAGGAWSDAASWSPAGVPATGDDVVLPALGGAYTVTLDVNARVTGLTVGSGATLTTGGTDSLVVLGTSIQNDGTIVIGPNAGNALTFGGARDTVEIAGSGSVQLRGAGVIHAPRSRPMLKFRMYNRAGQTIRGDGLVLVPVINQGRIEQLGTGNGLLTLGQYLWNAGTVVVRDGGRINVRYFTANLGGTIRGTNGWFTVQPSDDPQNYNYGAIDNLAGGTFVADGGDLDLKAGVVAGGTIVRENGAGVVGFHDTGNPNNLVVASGAEVLLDGGTNFHLDTQGLQNHGTVHVKGTLWLGTAVGDTASNPSDGVIALDGGTLMGGLNMAGQNQWILNYGTITGCGTIAGGFINAGTVDVECPVLYEDVTSAKFVNRGRIVVGRGYLRAIGTGASLRNIGVIDGANGGVLVEQGGTIDNRGGVLNAGRAGVTLGRGMTAATIVGGTLTSSAGHFVANGNVTLKDVTLSAGATLMTANRATTTATGASFTNRGTNRIEAGGTFVAGASTDYVQSEGATVLKGGTLNLARAFVVHGTLSGTGTVVGKLVNEGEVSPDVSANGLQLQGDFAQAKTGRLAVAIGGYDPSQFSRLVVSGDAALDGSVRAALTGGFVPDNGRSFAVLASATRSGQFAAVDAVAGLALTPLYEGPAVALLTPAPLAVPDAPSAPKVLRFATRGAAFALELPEAAEIDVRAFDVAGRQVAVLARGARAAGVHVLALRDALPGGVYFARASVRANGRVDVRDARLVHLK